MNRATIVCHGLHVLRALTYHEIRGNGCVVLVLLQLMNSDTKVLS
jgi:hypothetical protein